MSSIDMRYIAHRLWTDGTAYIVNSGCIYEIGAKRRHVFALGYQVVMLRILTSTLHRLGVIYLVYFPWCCHYMNEIDCLLCFQSRRPGDYNTVGLCVTLQQPK